MSDEQPADLVFPDPPPETLTEPTTKPGTARGLLFYAPLVFLMALCLRVVPATWDLHPTPDAVEYLAAAHSLKQGEGYQSPIKAYFPPSLEGSEAGNQVVHPAQWERAPLLPFMLSLFVDPSDRSSPYPQLLSAILGSLGAVLGCMITFRLGRLQGLGTSAAWGSSLLAGLMISTYPPFFWCSVRVLTEPLDIFLSLAAILALLGWERDVEGETKESCYPVLGGLAAGLLLWARPEGALFGILLALLLSVQKSWGLLARFCLAWLLCALPWWLGNLWMSGVIVPGQGFLFQVPSVHNIQWGYGSSSLDIELGAALSSIALNLKRYIVTVFEPRNSAFFGLFMVIAIFRNQPMRSWGRLLGLLGVVLILFRASLWATQDAYRFPTLSAFLWICLGAVQLGVILPGSAQKQRKWLMFALLLVFVGPGIRVLKRQLAREKAGSSWSHAGLQKLSEKAAENRNKNEEEPEIYCGTNPWALYLRTGKAAVLLPNQLSRAKLHRFLERFKVDAVLLAPAGQHPGVEEPLNYKEWLVSEGWDLKPLGDSFLLTRRKSD